MNNINVLHNPKIINRIGWFASLMALGMYVSYIDQILRNLAGNHGSIILPIITTINCIAWVMYAYLKQPKDWPIIMCNGPGIVFGLLTALTSI